MYKIGSYEMLFTKSMIAFFTISFFSTLFFNRPISSTGLYISLSFNFLVILWYFLRMFIVRTDVYSRHNLYNIMKIFEILLLIIFSQIVSGGLWASAGLIFEILFISISMGLKLGLQFAGLISSIKFFLGLVLEEIYTKTLFVLFLEPINFSTILLLSTTLAIVAIICAFISKNNIQTESENKTLVAEIEEKYDLLALAQNEIKHQYEKIKDTNKKLEDTNSRLSISIGEFYTLHQISQAISSILNINELLKYVNDVIIGVMGVNYCTIAVFDDKRNRLKVHTTNISNQNNLMCMSTNINCSAIVSTLDTGKPLMENNINDEKYPFTIGREINSLICMPLISKAKRLGLVIIEHKLDNALGNDKMRLLDIISKQVSIAMENADLYQKMHELANTDWLTGVYNRVYFQTRLSKELIIAEDNGYELSIGIFDIDWFKKFNDTYGHLFGDKVIKTIADVVKGSMRNTDVIARYGGEEFIILMPRTSMDEAYSKIENIRRKIENTIISDELVKATVTASFGVSSYPSSGITERELLKNADKALYQAKDSGRNCVRIYC